VIPQHLSLTQEHYTPDHVVEAARRTLGGIDLDPASCALANERVKAERWFGLPGDGLAEEWFGRVFLNPPGGTFTPKRKKKTDPKIPISASDAAHKLYYRTDSRACAWWRKLMDSHPCQVPAFVFVGFTVEILRSTQGTTWPSAMRFPICVPRERLCFGGDQPTHANVIIYSGPDFEAFKREFSQIGEVKP
jgi:hypothetical protein